MNRSQSFIHLKQYSEAITDATACLKLDKGNIKALLRRGIARREMGYTKESQSDFELGLVLDPLNSVLKRELEALKKWIKEKDEKKNANKIDNKSDVSDVIKKGDITLGLKKRLHIEEIGVPSDYLSLNKKSSVSNLDEQLLVKKAQKTRSIEVLDSNAIQIQQTNNVKEMESDFNTVIQSSSGIIIPINNQPSMSKVSKSASELEFKMKLSQKYASARKKLPTQIPATMYEFMRDWKRLSDPKDQFDYIRVRFMCISVYLINQLDDSM